MKKFVFTLAMFLVTCIAQAEGSRTIANTAGSLEMLLGTDVWFVTDLTVTGTMDARDFRVIRDMMPALVNLDISNVTISQFTGTGGTASGTGSISYPANQIPQRAFYNKTNFVSVLLPTTGTTLTLGIQAFYGFSSVNPLNIPKMLTNVAMGLNYCKAMFTVATDNTAFSALDGVLYNKSQTQITQVPTSKTGDFVIPSTITIINSGAFIGCNLLTSVAIPASVTVINGTSVFNYCTAQINVDAANTAFSSIDGVLFNKAQNTIMQVPISKTGEYIIPSTVTTINTNSFIGCTGLTSITIPRYATTIATSAFSGCTGLTLISVLIPTAPTLSGNPFFGVITSTCVLQVPTGSVSSYQNATTWNSFTNIVESSGLTISTNAVSSITTSTSILNGNISALGTNPITSYGFCWNTTGTPKITDNYIDKGAISAIGSFTHNLSGLLSNTKYYVRAYATSNGVTTYGSEVNFTTTSGLGTLTTQATSAILSTTATLNGTVSSLGENPVTSYGFCVNTTGNPSITDTKLDKGACSATGAFTFNATGLSPNTTYYAKSYATSSGTFYGNEISFTTAAALEISTNAPTSILAKSAILNGNINILTSSTISSYGFCWKTTGNTPVITDSKVDMGANPTAGAFANTISGLIPTTVYYVRAYAIDNYGTYYGNVQTFTTALPDTYNISIQISSNGNVSENNITLQNSSVLTVNRGTTKTFTLTPNEGYQISSVNYNGTDVYSQIINNQFTTPSVNANGTLVVTFGNDRKTINVNVAGTLSSLLTALDKANITNLTVTGNIDARDVKCMRDEMPLLAIVDLGGANIIAYSGNSGTNQWPWSSVYPANELPEYSFVNPMNAMSPKTSLTSIKFPASISSIGQFALKNCYNIKTIICLNIIPPTCGTDCYNGISPNAIYIPIGKVLAYKAVSGWGTFNILEYRLKATTQAVNSIKLTSAKLNGSIDLITDSPVSAHGFCWNTTGMPTTTDSKVDNGIKTLEGNFSNEISSLTEATTYYVRAFATDVASGTVYGDEISFTTATIPASSNAGGNYYNSQYWAKSKSPYTITSNVNLAEGTTLTIEPGVVVNFAGNYEIMTMGNIIANGVVNDSITFNANGNSCTFFNFKDTKLSDTELSYLIFNGFLWKPVNPWDNLVASKAIITQGICTDSVSISNVRAKNVALLIKNPLTFKNSKLTSVYNVNQGYDNNLAKVYIDNSTLNNSTFGSQYEGGSLIIENSTVDLLNITYKSGGMSSSSVVLSNSRVSNSNFNSEMFTNYKVYNSIITNTNLGGTYSSNNYTINKSKFNLCTLPLGWSSANFNADSCVFIKTSLGTSSIGGGLNTSIFNNCIFKTDSTQTLNLNGSFIKSQFIGNNNKIGGIGLDAVTGTITSSSIVNNRIGLQTGSLTINNSNFINNPSYTVINTGATIIDAKSNYWGVGNTTTSTVKAKIWDYYKDMNLGKVTYDNYLSAPNIDCPITPPQNFRKSAVSGGMNFTWNPNPETDIKGYKIYYGTFDGFTFANSIDVGNVTTYTLQGATLNDVILVTAYDLLADGKDDMIEGHESWYSDDVVFPAVAGKITGSITVCQGQNTVNYTVPVIANATSYTWTLPTGATGTSNTNSISVSYSKTASPGNIAVKGHNEWGDGLSSFLAINVNPLPADATIITGATTVCQGQNAVIYNVDAVLNATSYIWTLPTGATGTSTTNSITVNYGTSAVSGNVTVKGNNGCGSGVVSTLAITVNPLPANAGIITGSTSVCQGENTIQYSVPTIANATNYIWTLPTGATGTSTTSSITVNFAKTAISGNVTVKGNNTCGDGVVSSLPIIVKPLPVDAGIISGATTVCQGENTVVYTVPEITNATNYIWTLPTGATGTSSTRSITVNYSKIAVSGDITVKGNNTCGDGVGSTLAITVNPLPIAADIITGNAIVCQGENAVVYTVPTIENSTNYVWTLPTGATGTSTTNSITVNYSKTAISGNITVKGNNTCGDGVVSTLAITVNPLPANAGIITGSTSVCQGENTVLYSVPTIANATSYVWTLPTGATGTSTTNSITVNYGASAVSGNVTVKGHNNCGDGVASTRAITLKPTPESAGSISGVTTVCQGQNAVNYTVPTIVNATSYVWTLPSGASGTSTTNSINVNYGSAAVSGSITVKGINSNGCADGASSTLAITVNPLPANAGTITGSIAVCQGETSKVYTVSEIANATSYVWNLPNGATGTSTTNSISVNYGASALSGNVTVKGHNDCGDGVASTLAVTVKPTPGNAGNISGATTVCQGQNAVNYTVPTIANATSYVWTLPSGAIGSSSTKSINVTYGITAVSGNITVKGINSNGCTDGASSTLAITVNPLPASAGTITGATTVCQGESSKVYTVSEITNATSYIWTLPTGATGTSTTNSINVNYGASAVSGNVTVKGHNDCGDGAISTLYITVNSVPQLPYGDISGSTIVNQGQNSVVYNLMCPGCSSNATSYIWTLPSGATGTSTTTSIIVNYSTSAVTGNITVAGRNDCGVGLPIILPITVRPFPSAAGEISGGSSVCAGQSSVIYTVPPIENATSYNWTLPTGATGNSLSNSITVNYYTWATSGNITVKGRNSIGTGPSSTLSVSVTQPVGSSGAEAISGPKTVCLGETAITYTTPLVDNATWYEWTLPSGVTGTSTTNSITVDYGPTAISGSIFVKAKNSCFEGYGSGINVVVILPIGNAGSISGEATVCQGQNDVTYTVSAIDNATSYEWTLPTGATGTSITNSISVDFSTSAVAGDITVKGKNSCGSGSSSSSLTVSVNPLPASAGTIIGKTSVCQGESSVIYTVPVIENATSYSWTLPDGVSGSSTTNSITVDYGTSAISGNITVKGHNDCGDGMVSTLPITINQLPVISVSDKTIICGGSVSLNATTNYSGGGILEYLWTPSTGLSDNTIANPTATLIADKTYTLTVKTPNGCTTSKDMTVRIIPMSKPSICMVGVHSSNKNIVIWEKPVSTGIESFNIYRETNVTNVYEVIGSVSYSASSVFIDDTSLPDVQSNNYRLSILDKVGFESEQSNLHKTLHLSINKGLNTTWNLNWEKYEGFTVSTYNIYRGTTLNNLALIGSTSGSNSQFSDINAPTGDVYYQLEVVNPTTCNPARASNVSQKIKSINGSTLETYSSSRSNIATNVAKTVTGFDSNNSSSFKVYPNPVQNELRIEFEGSAHYEVINMVGQVIYNGNLIKSAILETSNLVSGVYIVKLTTGKTFEYKKIVKE